MKRPRTSPRPAGEAQDRLRGLAPAQAAQLRRAMQLFAAGDRMMAGVELLELARTAPDHPEVLRCQAQRHLADEEWESAIACLARSHALRPGDFSLLLQLGAAQDQVRDHEAAPQSLRAAAACAGTAAEWLALSLEFDRQGYVEEALSAVEHALAHEPGSGIALLQRARCATALGQALQAAADCRTLITRGELLARAWFMLADLKVVPLDGAELALLERTASVPPRTATAEEHLLLQFALGKALEDAGRFDEAFAVLQRANQAASVTRPWDGAAFALQVAAIRAAFEAAPPAPPGELGREVIFLVGLPRSGTTLVEQVLASHSQVEGASELPYLGRVIEQESRRRGRPLTDWAAAATPDDWQRLGREYLQQSARWRTRRPVATDKLPENWLLAAAALRMLPGARVVDCRRDAVETCWSCYKQLFGPGMVHFSYSFEGLASYWHAYDGLTRHWARLHAGRFFQQTYEALVADPEAQIRGLLQACGLPFEAACLDFHLAQRAIRTPSALQVRQPLRQASTPGARYGARLDPLRRLLAAP